MKKFLYVGPPSSITLGKKHESKEIILGTNAEVELPEEHRQVARLRARGLLIAPELALREAKDEPEGAGLPASKPSKKKPANAPTNSTPEDSPSE